MADIDASGTGGAAATRPARGGAGIAVADLSGDSAVVVLGSRGGAFVPGGFRSDNRSA